MVTALLDQPAVLNQPDWPTSDAILASFRTPAMAAVVLEQPDRVS